MKDSYDKDTLESMSQAVWYNQWITGQFKKFLYGDILEIGCGVGNFTNQLLAFGKVSAIDINKDYLKRTKKLIGSGGKVGFGDIEKGSYFFKKNKKFDTIVFLNVLEHIQDDEAALNNLFNLLKKGGKLILIVPSQKFLYGEIDRSIGHFRRYEKTELIKKLRSIGFETIKSKKLNFLGAIGWFIAGKILREKKIKKGNIKIFNLIAPFILSLENLLEPILGISILVIAQRI